MTGRFRFLSLVAGLLLVPSSLAQNASVPTRVVVRAVANDAKIIGDGVGGAYITIQEVETGRMLAEGRQSGGTGSTEFLVEKPRPRGQAIYDTDGAASFEATLLLEDPTLVDITAVGPLDPPHAALRSTKRILLLPGSNVDGNGILLELNGLVTEILEPQARISSNEVEVTARVILMCGCPTEPGGLWDSDRITVTARLVRDGRTVDEATLRYAGETSTYTGTLTTSARGAYELIVTASDPDRANFGMDGRTVVY